MRETITVKGLIDEDFVNYRKLSMFIALGHCDWKCCKEANIPITVCQNSELAKAKDIVVPIRELFDRYINNPITNAICIGGLEPMTVSGYVLDLIEYFRTHGCEDDFVIYTGYYKDEIPAIVTQLQKYPNVIIKFGRFVPNSKERYDEVLGITLVSDNQYAERIS